MKISYCLTWVTLIPFQPTTFYWSSSTKPVVCADMYMCLIGIDFTSTFIFVQSLLHTCHTFEQIWYQLVINRDIFLISSKFAMYCAGCGNIPFWRWLTRKQRLTTSIMCNDFNGEKLSNLQPNKVTDCFGEYLCTLGFESIIKFIAYTLKISTRFSMKNSLKMPKKKSEAVIRRTDNTMAKW